MAVGHGWVTNPRDLTALAGASADRAVRLDGSDARALTIAGHVKSYFLHDVQSALQLHAQAIKLNPNLPIAWTLSSFTKSYNGEHATAIKHATVSHSLSPRDPHLHRREDAADSLLAIRAIDPTVTITKIVNRIPTTAADREYYAEGLRRAGVPD